VTRGVAVRLIFFCSATIPPHMKKTAFVIGDSLPLPRGALLPAVSTWPYLLQERFQNEIYFVSECIGGGTTDALKTLVTRNAGYYRPQIAVVQLGVVDAAPRTLMPHEKEELDRLLGIPEVMEEIFRAHHDVISSARNITYVPLERFIDNCAAIFGALAQSRCAIVAIPIQPAYYRFAEAAPTFNDGNRVEYNDVIRRTVEATGGSFLSEIALTESAFLLDGHHLNMIGHRAVFEAVAARLDALAIAE